MATATIEKTQRMQIFQTLMQQDETIQRDAVALLGLSGWHRIFERFDGAREDGVARREWFADGLRAVSDDQLDMFADEWREILATAGAEPVLG